MKRICFLSFTLFLFISCQKDDNDLSESESGNYRISTISQFESELEISKQVFTYENEDLIRIDYYEDNKFHHSIVYEYQENQIYVYTSNSDGSGSNSNHVLTVQNSKLTQEEWIDSDGVTGAKVIYIYNGNNLTSWEMYNYHFDNSPRLVQEGKISYDGDKVSQHLITDYSCVSYNGGEINCDEIEFTTELHYFYSGKNVEKIQMYLAEYSEDLELSLEYRYTYVNDRIETIAYTDYSGSSIFKDIIEYQYDNNGNITKQSDSFGYTIYDYEKGKGNASILYGNYIENFMIIKPRIKNAIINN